MPTIQLVGILPNTKNPICRVGLSPSVVLKWKKSKYDWEIMLISRQIKECKCEKLFERLQRFVVQAEYALNTSLELWGV